MIRRRLSLSGIRHLDLFGQNDHNLRLMEEEFDARIVVRGEEVMVEGKKEEAERVTSLITLLMTQVKRGGVVGEQDVIYAINMVKEKDEERLSNLYRESVILSTPRGPIRARSVGQREYVDAITEHDLVVGIGPAGTGKTYLAVALAVAALQKRTAERIILARPAVEAGENLGYLPGDYHEKIDPYLRPLYDALYDMLPADRMRRYLDMRLIEVAPLAYMRGRTLNDSFIILDEAQNTTGMQMKMFLTRLGFGSKAVITGDITQIDLPRGCASGLVEIQHILRDVSGVHFVYLTELDVVRHRLVSDIIRAYERYDGRKGEDR
ncbi:phosphate starvation-inducible protein PhoH [candidate division TA06 bacterium DG_24]|uniref:PhoH-like protein n=3 Tax=Bacteria division TA06 TaxID=1156500 RepID=A0A0S8JQ81_UNCT6|nr:MAG: phosphate starvation-inducible protein PhoH [candidate division TA06 bacterium DG_24]KPK70651.1 MAG: phosphate starvation-inducible protein PhoH [candidate division TA06 bacterium SM23_40]KPL10941.1 MAG: phosphate starvation-inducible protein PhoH [candidate division TA06 bacterium SM1_40]